MSFTKTVTGNYVFQNLAFTPPTFRKDYKLAMDRLEAILNRFESLKWEDHLSERLFKWGIKVLQDELNEASDEKMKISAVKRLNKLVGRILVNPLAERPFRCPFLFNGFVFEKETIPEQSGAVPHQFAQDMLLWIKSLQSLFSIRTVVQTQMQVPNGLAKAFMDIDPASLSETELLLAKQLICCGLVEKWSLEQQLRDERKEIKQTSQKIETFVKETKIRVQEAANRAKEAEAAHEIQIQTRIENIGRNHSETVGILHGRIDQADARITYLQDTVEALASKTREQEKSITLLQASYQEKLRAVSSLRQESRKRSLISIKF